MLDFTTGGGDGQREGATDAVEITFQLDGRTMTALKPKKWHWAQMAAGMRRDAEAGEQFKAIAVFMDRSLDATDASHLQNRLEDINDRLDLEHLIDIFNQLVDAWGPEMRREFDEMGNRMAEVGRRERAQARARARSGSPQTRALSNGQGGGNATISINSDPIG